MEGSKITRNSLDARQMRKLGDWLASYPGPPGILKTIKAADLAADANVCLGFDVTPQNVKTAAKAAGVEVWSRPIKPKAPKPDPELFTLQDLGRRVAELERRVAELEANGQPNE